MDGCVSSIGFQTSQGQDLISPSVLCECLPQVPVLEGRRKRGREGGKEESWTEGRKEGGIPIYFLKTTLFNEVIS